MPVKGSRLKYIFPKPELRLMGDADILIKLEQYPDIENIMYNLGFTFHGKTDHDYCWISQDLIVELHYALSSYFNDNYKSYFGSGWKLAKHNIGHEYYMDDEDEFIYLFIHFAKHYRGGGIGIRHVTDLWVYLLKHPNLNLDYIENILKKLSVYEFYKNTMNLIDMWFNDANGNGKTELMTDYIFNSGSWGTVKSHAVANVAKNKQLDHSNDCLAKIKYFIEIVFQPYDELKNRYTILEKYPVLLPFMWVYRWFDALIFRFSNVKINFKSVKSAYDSDVSDFEKSLSYVGLDYCLKEKTEEK